MSLASDSAFCKDVMRILKDPFIDLAKFNGMTSLRDSRTGDTVLHCILKLPESRPTKKMLHFYIKRIDEVMPDERTKFEALNRRNKSLDTPLHSAITYFDTKKYFVNELLKQHVDLTIEDEYLRTPLDKAAFFGDTVIVKSLMEFGADPSKANSRGDTPLHFANMSGSDVNVKTIRVLLNDERTDVNAQNDEGETPLHLLARTKNSVASLAAMHRRGADPNIKNRKGETPIDIMYKNKRDEYIDYFRRLQERKEKLKNQNKKKR